MNDCQVIIGISVCSHVQAGCLPWCLWLILYVICILFFIRSSYFVFFYKVLKRSSINFVFLFREKTVKENTYKGVRVRILQQYFSYIVVVSFIGGGNHNTQRKPPTCRMSLTNYQKIINYFVFLFREKKKAKEENTYKTKKTSQI
jgi:hypothetical protein